jgi:hypothetical protein
MTAFESSGHNIGELMRTGTALTTREVLALIHEACRDTAAAVPQSPDDLWLTDTGELLIARSDQITTPIDPRHSVAALLEAMLPPEGDSDRDRAVPPALRGLPQRLRATGGEEAPQARRDLMSILAWHINGDPRDVVRQLVARVFHPVAAAVAADAENDIDLFETETPPAAVPAPPATRGRALTALALAALALLFIGIGSASYWLFRDDGAPAADADDAAAVVETEVPLSPDTAPIVSPRVQPSAAQPIAPLTPQPLRIDARDGAFSPTFASSGRELFFHAGRAAAGRLLVADLDPSGHVARVSAIRDEGARDYHPRVSPDGRWIAFDSDRDGERGVYVAGREGGSVQRVSGSGYAAVPSWSPDMKRLAFVRGEPSRPRVWNLWIRDLSTGVLQRHTSFRSGQVWGASWFPDGRALCYSHDEQLVISHLDAREDIVIDTPRRGHLVRTPAVSPDGKAVIFQVFKDGVWLLDVPARTMRRILDDPTAEEFAWSPEGDRVAYHSRRDGAWKIWVMGVPAAATESR